MTLNEKLKAFAAQLTDHEIREQLSDIFEWAKTYQRILEDEQAARRQGQPSSSPSFGITRKRLQPLADGRSEGDAAPNLEPAADAASLDYFTMQAINSKLESMSEEELEAALAQLKGIPTEGLPAELDAKLQYEIEACELHLLAMREPLEEDVTCPNCGKTLPYGAQFCTKCGTKLC